MTTERQPATFEFVTDGPAWKGTPVVNGHKLMSVMSADVHLDANSFPEVTLRLFAGDLLKLDLGAAVVKLDNGTREALISLGWTPPADGPTGTGVGLAEGLRAEAPAVRGGLDFRGGSWHWPERT